MRQVIRRPIVIYAIALGLMTAHVSLLQSIPSVSAQQVTGSAYQGNSETGSQGRRIESLDPRLLYPTKSLEKKDTQSLTYKPHRLIRKPQNAPVASIEPSPSSSSSVNSLPTPSPSLQNDNTIPQSKEPSSFTGSARPTVPLATVSVAPSFATATGSAALGTASTGTIPLAAAGAGNSSGSAGGRSMSKLAAEMPGLAQLMSPPSAPAPSTPPPTINPAIGASPAALSFTATQGGANPAPQTVTISNTGGTLSWNASETAAWLTLSPASGSGAGTLTATVNTASLATGPHTTTITVAASGATSRTVGVTLTMNAPASSSANLTWNTNAESDLAGYKVYRATSSGAYGAPIATLTGNVTTYVATALQVGTTYYFVVTAYDNAGNESILSNEVSKSIF